MTAIVDARKHQRFFVSLRIPFTSYAAFEMLLSQRVSSFVTVPTISSVSVRNPISEFSVTILRPIRLSTFVALSAVGPAVRNDGQLLFFGVRCPTERPAEVSTRGLNLLRRLEIRNFHEGFLTRRRRAPRKDFSKFDP